MTKVPPENSVEVDMVPLIDIVTLLLMFLIVVGDTARTARAVQMRLPHADQAIGEKEGKIGTEGRLVVQLSRDQRTNKYCAVIQNKWYELQPRGEGKSLLEVLDEHVKSQVSAGKQVKKETGEVSIPVKLRIPADAPMREVERLVRAISSVGFVNVHYACSDKPMTARPAG